MSCESMSYVSMSDCNDLHDPEFDMKNIFITKNTEQISINTICESQLLSFSCTTLNHVKPIGPSEIIGKFM